MVGKNPVPLNALKIAGRLSKESGSPLDDILAEHEQKSQEIDQKRKAPSGKFRVLGIDKFDRTDWIEGDYDTAVDALRVAREKTREAMRLASDASVATVWYAYDSKGKYLGGDVWNNE